MGIQKDKKSETKKLGNLYNNFNIFIEISLCCSQPIEIYLIVEILIRLLGC
jgi:hypothetical protein